MIPRLPVTVIAGYLGAGKTTLVNHLLRNPGGRRIMVMVNDFGAINIDADLLESADEDTLTLSNGCICCTMGTELIYALADALDRRPRPDCLVIEASGVAQPEKIATAAKAEPEMTYGGIVTLADAANIGALLADPLIGPQVQGQISVADLVLLTKTDLADGGAARSVLSDLTPAQVIDAPHGQAAADLLLDRPEVEGNGERTDFSHARVLPQDHVDGHAHNHAHGEQYQSWSATGGAADRQRLMALLQDPPAGLYRLKGRVALQDGTWAEAHLVGRTHALTPCSEQDVSRMVGIGLTARFDPATLDTIWRSITSD